MCPSFIKSISKKTGTTIKLAEAVINVAFEELAGLLEREDKLTIPGFTTFCVIETKDRKARNPGTEKEMTIPARRVVRFRPSSALKQRVE